MGIDISNALTIMVVGMLTVFFILWLVVLIGNAIILIVNRTSSDEETNGGNKTTGISSKQNALAAIVATVDVVTQGKGKIVDIKQI